MDKIAERIRKLLALSKSTNEHEAAQAAARASAMMAAHNLTEAMLEVQNSTHEREEIADEHLPEELRTGKRVAWRERISKGVAMSLGCSVYLVGSNHRAFGRKSAVQTWTYTCAYLFREVDRLADDRWNPALASHTSARAWKGSFRLGAAVVIASRLSEAAAENRKAQYRQAAELAPGDMVAQSQALAVIDRQALEVADAYKEKSKREGFVSARGVGTIGNTSGFAAGRAAGATVSLGSPARGIAAPRSALKR